MEILLKGAKERTVNTNYLVSRRLENDGRLFIVFIMVGWLEEVAFFDTELARDTAFSDITDGLVSGAKTLTIITI